MTSLSEFLTARYAEYEAAARAATGDEWVAGRGEVMYGNCAPHQQVVGPNGWYNPVQADVEHIARHDPARILAECEAKRRIVSYCEAHIPLDDRNPNGSHGISVLLMLALPYSAHPDYQQEWAL